MALTVSCVVRSTGGLGGGTQDNKVSKGRLPRVVYHQVYQYMGVVVTEESSYLRLNDSCFTQLRAQGPSRTCTESKEEKEGVC